MSLERRLTALEREEITTPKRRVQREHVFQGIVDRFLDRVVLPPMWTTGINHENELTANARARAAGRGVKSGVHDIYICQAPARAMWLELKWGDGKQSGAQLAVAEALWRCGVPRECCWTMAEVLRGLRDAGFKLHANADNLAIEYQARAEAAVRAAEERAARPYKVGRARAVKPSPGAVARYRRVGVIV